MTKRLLSVTFVILFLLFSFSAHIFAVSSERSDALELCPGDVNGDGSVTAEDARYALRASVGLDDAAEGLDFSNPVARCYHAADVDGEAGISAADARLILRVAVGLEHLEDWLVTKFEMEDQWYMANGNLAGTPGKCYHSQKLPVVPGQKLYGSFFANRPQSCAGAFFDADGQWLAPILLPSAEMKGLHAKKFAYTPADVTPAFDREPYVIERGGFGYCVMYEFTVPENARYISVNLNLYVYRYEVDGVLKTGTMKNVQSLSTLPMLGVTDSGNREWKYTDPMCRKKREKKLYIIGASTAAIDRAYRLVYDAANAADTKNNPAIEPIVGFQEYLIPYYKEVVSLGFNGVGYRYDAASTDPRSIYMYITGNTDPGSALYNEPNYYLDHDVNDLTDADEVLILVDSNNISSEKDLGEYNSADVGTYCGAVNCLIDHILALNTDHPVNLYLELHPVNPGERRNIYEQINRRHRQIAEAKGVFVVDVSRIGITENDYRYYTYDSQLEMYSPFGSHFNNLGNMKVGFALSEKMLLPSDTGSDNTKQEAGVCRPNR